MKVDQAWASSTDERVDRVKHSHRRSFGWRRDVFEGTGLPREKRMEIGGNNPPPFDPDQEVTGFPSVLSDVKPFTLQDGTEITSRSQLREYQSAHKVEQVGLEYTGEEKPHYWDEYKAHRRENEKRAKAGKPLLKWKTPPKPKKKAEKIAVSYQGVHCAKTMRKLT